MRIIAGKKRGLQLLSPKGDISRPITDRVKESLFSVLYKYDIPAEMVVADIFSGVGSIGLEALSRGANALMLASEMIIRDKTRKRKSPSGIAASC